MANFAASGDFESLARQYWNLWSDALRQGALGAQPQAPGGWQQAMDAWARLMPGNSHPVEEMIGRFQRQSQDWYGQMQQLAAQFAGRDHGASDIRNAWQQMLGLAGHAHNHNPFADLFQAVQGPGVTQIDGWLRQVEPYLESFRRDGSRWLQMPAFGPMREHQERWQALAQAQQDYQQRQGEYNALMLGTLQRALDVFERDLHARAENGNRISSARGLFDAWIDAAEAAYAESALSPEFRHAFGALANAQMRLRQGIQKEVEHVCGLFGMPTRTEIDSAHRRIAELERMLRKRGAQPQPQAAAGPSRRAAPAAAKTDAAPGRATPAPAVETTEAAPPRRRAAAPRKHGAAAASSKRGPAVAARPADDDAPAAGKRRTPARKPARPAAAPAKGARKPRTAGKHAATAAKSTATRKTADKARRAPAARRQLAAKASSPAKVERRPAAPPKRTPKAQPAAAAPVGVVSMKDWVARNAAAQAATPATTGGKRSKRK